MEQIYVRKRRNWNWWLTNIWNSRYYGLRDTALTSVECGNVKFNLGKTLWKLCWERLPEQDAHLAAAYSAEAKWFLAFVFASIDLDQPGPTL